MLIRDGKSNKVDILNSELQTEVNRKRLSLESIDEHLSGRIVYGAEDNSTVMKDLNSLFKELMTTDGSERKPYRLGATIEKGLLNE